MHKETKKRMHYSSLLMSCIRNPKWLAIETLSR